MKIELVGSEWYHFIMENERKIPWIFLAVPFLLIVSFLFLMSIGSPENAYAMTTHSTCKISYRADLTIAWGCRRLLKGETLEALFGDRWQDVARFNRIDRRHLYPGISLKVPKRLDDIRDYTPMPRHYQPAESEPKLILVDLSEQFLGAYEHGQLIFSAPIATGARDNATPQGTFRITAYSREHRSSLYQIEKSTKFYPMNYALRFYVDRDGVSYWFHGRDLPGYPASHGCIGLYDENMQHDVYKSPAKPELEDAKKLFEWALSPLPGGKGLQNLENGPKVLIIGNASGSKPFSR